MIWSTRAGARRMRWLPSAAVLVALGLAVASVRGQSSGLPAHWSVSEVLVGARVQGHRVDTHAVRSPDDCAVTVSRLRRVWQAQGHTAVIDAAAGEWQLLSAMARRGFLSSQWRPAVPTGCEGFVSAWPLPTFEARQASVPDSSPPGLFGVHWHGRWEDVQAAGVSVSTGESPSSSVALAAQWRDRLRDARWQVLGERTGPAGRVLEARGPHQRAVWILTDRHARTEVVLISERIRP